MLFAAGHGYRLPLTGLNSAPLVSQGSRGLPATGGQPQAYTSEATLSAGTATSDGKLVKAVDGWRVVSDQTELVNAPRIQQTAQDIITQKPSIYVGPFPLDPNAPGGQITTIETPYNISNRSAWGQWMSDAATKLWANLKLPDQARTVPPQPWLTLQLNGAVSFLNSTNLRSGQWKCPQGCSCTPIPNAAADADPKTQLIDPKAIQSYGPGPMCVVLSWINATSVDSHPDQTGVPTEWVTYSGDPNTYGWFDTWDWLESLKTGLASKPSSGLLLIDARSWAVDARTIDQAITNRLLNYDATTNLPPLAKFSHPLTGEDWGIWIVLAPDSIDIPLGAWNTSTDRPNGMTMYATLSPMPSEPWYDYLIDAIEWIPGLLGDLANDLVDAIQNLVCTDSAKAKAMAGTNPYAQAALSAAALLCPKGPPVTNCADPANAQLPQCMPPPKPWWQQWYVIVPAIVLVIALFSGGHKPAQAQKG